MKRNQPWLLVELGGSSAQTAQQSDKGYRFTTGIVRETGRPVALACPGLIRGNEVWYATNLGWPEVADPRRELGIDSIAIVVNDADATALGESVLRGNGSPTVDLYYIGLGTGVGSAAVRNGSVEVWNLGHTLLGGDAYCEGCRAHGCLNAYLAADRLADPLDSQGQRYIVEKLAAALALVATQADTLIVLGGGIGRRYPTLAKHLATLVANPIEPSSAAPEAKSAAYAGLDFLARMDDQTADA